MMRGKPGLVGLLLVVAGLTGCKQQLFMTEGDYGHYRSLGLPDNLENDPHATLYPDKGTTPTPATILDAERPVRYLSLKEAIATALEQGRVGSQSPLFPGITNDQLLTFSGLSPVGSDAIRVLSLDPAIVGGNIERALSKFDVQWLINATWTKQDQAIANLLANFQNGDQSRVDTSLVKPLPTGGLAGITLSMDYLRLSQPPANSAGLINPSFRPTLQFTFEQPLLRNYGVEINQLTAAHPGSQLINIGPIGGQVEGILITRLRYDEVRADFERNVAFLLLNIETAYWNLYGAYYSLYSRDEGLKQSYTSYRIAEARFRAGRTTIQDFQQTRAQYELFRSQRITALGTVLENERQVRTLMGLPPEDGFRLVPSDAPTLAPFQPDWAASRDECLANRPELTLARQDLKFRQLDLIAQRNLMRPDLRFFSTYNVNGIGTRLDGGGVTPATAGSAGGSPNNALQDFAQNQFHSWELGIRMQVPIGTRDAHAAVRIARLNLTRSYLVLKEQESRAESSLAIQYRRLFEFYEQIRANRSQREANAEQLRARFRLFEAGQGAQDVFLEAQRNFADALAQEFQAIVSYNNALCGFQFAKGTLLAYDNVTIADGPLPAIAQVRAVDHLRERTIALVGRQRAVPEGPTDSEVPGVPQLPHDAAPPVPDVLGYSHKVPEVNEPLPTAERATKASPQPANPTPTVPVRVPTQAGKPLPMLEPVNNAATAPVGKAPALVPAPRTSAPPAAMPVGSASRGSEPIATPDAPVPVLLPTAAVGSAPPVLPMLRPVPVAGPGASLSPYAPIRSVSPYGANVQ